MIKRENQAFTTENTEGTENAEDTEKRKAD